MSTIIYLWSLPYLRWHILFSIIPTILLWGFGWRYLMRYKKTILLVSMGALFWGIPLDILATPVFHIYFYPGHNLGLVWKEIPFEELMFLLLIPQAVTCIALLIRGVLYGKIRV